MWSYFSLAYNVEPDVFLTEWCPETTRNGQTLTAAPTLPILHKAAHFMDHSFLWWIESCHPVMKSFASTGTGVEDWRLLGCYTLWISALSRTFQRGVVPPSSQPSSPVLIFINTTVRISNLATEGSLTCLQDLAKASQPTLLLNRKNSSAITLCHLFLTAFCPSTSVLIF